jgi:DNA-binding CsgD family transcriptional regulator
MSKPGPLDVIDQLYDAALVPAKWPQALETLALACGGLGVAVSRGRIPEPALASPSLQRSTAEYARNWWRHDSRAPRLGQAYRGRPVTDSDLFTVEERRHDPYYQEFLRLHGVENFAAIVLSPMPGMNLTVSVEGPQPFGTSELDTFSLLAPHVSRALATTSRLALTEAFSRDLVFAAEHLKGGLIFLTPEGQAGFANDQAASMFNDGLNVDRGRVVAANAQDQAMLDRLIARILSGSAHSDERVFISRPSGKSPLVVQGVPIPPKQQPSLDRLGVAGGGGLLLIHDLASERSPSVARDLERMGLTRAQARVAELVGSGVPVKQAAEALGTAEGTVRVQLKAVFARLGVTRQSELAILITKLASLRHS